MKIISWNVNGIRAVAKKGFNDFIKTESPDVLCIQETKAFEEQCKKELGSIEGYNYLWHAGKTPGYAGTVIFYKKALTPDKLSNSFENLPIFSDDGRITEIKIGKLRIINAYMPNGGTKADGTEMLSYKLDFYNKIISYCNDVVNSGDNIIFTGDLNIAHTEIDIARPKENQNSIGFLPIERNKISEFLGNGYIDVFRYFYPEEVDKYTWWSYRAGARVRNVGWRLDYFLTNKTFIERIKKVKHLDQILGSDHCPILLEI